MAVDKTKFEEFFEGIEEEQFIDDLFPPEKKSVLGYGCGSDMQGEPRDKAA